LYETLGYAAKFGGWQGVNPCLLSLQEELVTDLSRLEKRLLKELGFVCHVEHPHKFIPSYLNVLDAPELMQVAWNLANDR
jgi:hypothetical protein